MPHSEKCDVIVVPDAAICGWRQSRIANIQWRKGHGWCCGKNWSHADSPKNRRQYPCSSAKQSNHWHDCVQWESNKPHQCCDRVQGKCSFQSTLELLHDDSTKGVPFAHGKPFRDVAETLPARRTPDSITQSLRSRMGTLRRSQRFWPKS